MANWKEISLTARANVRLAATQLKEKNRRLAAANRLRTAIRCQEKAAEKEYLALGRYYYNVLRDPDNPVAEAHCLRLDQLQAQRDRALQSGGDQSVEVDVGQGGQDQRVHRRERGLFQGQIPPPGQIVDHIPQWAILLSSQPMRRPEKGSYPLAGTHRMEQLESGSVAR